MKLVEHFANRVTGRQTTLDEALHTAIRNWDEAGALKALDDGANPNATKFFGITPLMDAVRAQLPAVATRLLDMGAKINAVDETGKTALSHAVGLHDRSLADLLLSRGADPLACNEKERKSLLLYAVTRGIEGVAKPLIDAGTDIVQRTANGKTLIMLAAEWGQARMIELLAAAGADIHEKLPGEKVANATIGDGKSLIYTVVEKGYADCIPVLAQLGADMQEKTVYGCSLLFAPINNGHVQCIQPLVNAGVDPTLADQYQRTPFTYALQFDQLTSAEVFYALTHPDLNAPDKNGNHLLNECLQWTRPKVVPFLLKNGADPNRKSKNGYTTLREALHSIRDDATALQALLDAGADTRADSQDNEDKNKSWCSDLEYARRHVKPEHLALVEKAAAKFSLIDAAKSGNVGEVRGLLAQGAPVDFADSKGWTPLGAAIVAGKWEVVELLLDNKANANIIVPPSLTALESAIVSGEANSVRAVARALPDVALNGDDALLLACTASNDAMVRVLLELGVKADLQTKDGDCPAHAAIRSGSIPCLDLLIAQGAKVEVPGASGKTCLALAEASPNAQMYDFVRAQRSTEMQDLAEHATHLGGAVKTMKSLKFKAPGT
ncbi:MAG: ankyrin repeat domain-containing protein [Alphaproteobacteria bacterium]